jgi:hypothetical protein
MIAVVAASTLVAYIIYCLSSETTERFGTDWLVRTVPFPMDGIFRYLNIVHHKGRRRESIGDAAERSAAAGLRRALELHGGCHHLSAIRVLTDSWHARSRY